MNFQPTSSTSTVHVQDDMYYGTITSCSLCFSLINVSLSTNLTEAGLPVTPPY